MGSSRYHELFSTNRLVSEAYAVTLTDGSSRWGIPRALIERPSKFHLTMGGGQIEELGLEQVDSVTRLVPCPVRSQTGDVGFTVYVPPEQAFGAVSARGTTHVLGLVLEPSTPSAAMIATSISINGVDFMLVRTPMPFGPEGRVRLDLRRS